MKTTYIIEDDAALAAGIKAALERGGFTAEIFSDGNLALEKIARKKPDIVILDVLLPHANGFKIARLIRFSENTKDIPIMITSVRKEKSDMSLAASLGVDAYFGKPFVMDELVQAVKVLLDRNK